MSCMMIVRQQSGIARTGLALARLNAYAAEHKAMHLSSGSTCTCSADGSVQKFRLPPQ